MEYMLMAVGEGDFETVLDNIKFKKSSSPEIMDISLVPHPQFPRYNHY